MKVIPEINFNEEFNGDLNFDLEVDLHDFFKVNFVFLIEAPFFYICNRYSGKFYAQVRTQVIGQL